MPASLPILRRYFLALAILISSLATSHISTRAQSAGDQLVTRTFKLNPSLLSGVQLSASFEFTAPPPAPPIAPDEPVGLKPLLQQPFTAAGISFPADPLSIPARPNEKAMFLNERTGVLMIRATLSDLDKIEAILNRFTAPPTQVSIEATFIEFPAPNRPPPFRPALGFDASALTNVGILTEKQFRAALARLEKAEGLDVVTAPVVTTISGRQARISMEQTKTIIYDTPPPLPRDTRPDADPTPLNKRRLPFPPTFKSNS